MKGEKYLSTTIIYYLGESIRSVDEIPDNNLFSLSTVPPRQTPHTILDFCNSVFFEVAVLTVLCKREWGILGWEKRVGN